MHQSTMNNIRTIENIDSKEWNTFAIHPMQSYEWGEARKKTGVRVVRFGEYENNLLKAVFQMSIHKLPGLPFFIGYIPRSSMPSKEIADFIFSWAQKEHLIFIKWEPYAEGDISLSHMRKSPHSLFPEWNQEIDLRQEEDVIFRRFRSTTRYAIRTAEKLGVDVREMNSEEGFKIFSDLYFQTTDRQRYHGHTKKYHKTIWDILSASGIARMFVAFYEERPLAAFEIFFFGDKVYYPYSGSSNTDRKVPGAQYLMWKVAQIAKDEGKVAFDLWGSLPPEYKKKHSWQGFTFFKKGFGTNYVHLCPSTDQVIRPLLYMLYNLVYTLRSLVWKLR